jgi:hypothetical protein
MIRPGIGTSTEDVASWRSVIRMCGAVVPTTAVNSFRVRDTGALSGKIVVVRLGRDQGQQDRRQRHLEKCSVAGSRVIEPALPDVEPRRSPLCALRKAAGTPGFEELCRCPDWILLRPGTFQPGCGAGHTSGRLRTPRPRRCPPRVAGAGLSYGLPLALTSV